MNFDELSDFIRTRMRMSHVYQPVMLRVLLRHGGQSTRSEIARALLADDESQIEYYEQITDRMVGAVLRRHGIVSRDRAGYHLCDFDSFKTSEIDELVSLCEQRLVNFIEKRGSSIWLHRRRSGAPISGTVRYDVLKRAKYHCDLCGISASDKALEVDHILPRNCGGGDDRNNLQALCYSCNAMKRDRDDTDFRRVREAYDFREPGCPFCWLPPPSVIAEVSLAVAIRDQFPVTQSHTLVLPRRHAPTYFDLGQPELNACNQLLVHLRDALMEEDPSIRGFNVGVNDGVVAGQNIGHCHIHLIPRRLGDVLDPQGGVRNVLP